jgi:hypothetical protein
MFYQQNMHRPMESNAFYRSKREEKRSLTIIQKKKKNETYDPDQHHKQQQQQFGKRIDLTVFVMLNDHLFPSLLYFNV